MMKYIAVTVFGLSLLTASAALAGEKTVTLTVQNMYCSACPITVKSRLEAVPQDFVSFAARGSAGRSCRPRRYRPVLQ